MQMRYPVTQMIINTDEIRTERRLYIAPRRVVQKVWSMMIHETVRSGPGYCESLPAMANETVCHGSEPFGPHESVHNPPKVE